MGRTDLAGSMSVELISVLIAVLAIRATLAGLILTSNHGLRQDMRLLAMVALLTAGCTPNQPTIPDDVSYSIIDSTARAGIKRSLDVRLNKRVAEDTLHAIALKLKSQDSRDYDRTFITYYLPGMTVGAGAWATTHFTPQHRQIDYGGLNLSKKSGAHSTAGSRAGLPGRSGNARSVEFALPGHRI